MKRFLKFWGTRGSCPVSGPEYLHFGGNTACLELRYDPVHIVFDAGTGIRPLGKILMKDKVTKIDLFLSHTHWDHLLGFPFFELIYQNDVSITIWSPPTTGRSCKELFKELLAPEFFPMRLSELQANLQFKVYSENTPLQMGPITISFHKVNHPGVTYCFKIQTPHQIIGYTTDNELNIPFGKEEKSIIEFFRGADLLIHEAQYFTEEYVQKKGWGHSSLLGAMEFVEKTEAKKWLVSHHDPAHTDEDLVHLSTLALQRSSIPSEWLRDGQVIELR
ncbi:MAG: MBL fold metallo-hydrolase [Verrucomicrobia bacterium]|nr:MBL fold metallo-hydrolase [Verrucomicrobiota bacterium]